MDAAATASAPYLIHLSDESDMETPCKKNNAKTALAKFTAFLEAKRKATTDKRASKTDCGKKGAKDALKSILTIDLEGRDIRILTNKELERCFEKALADYQMQLDTLPDEWSKKMCNGKPVTGSSKIAMQEEAKILTKAIKHLGDVKNIQNLMLAINCFQESQAHCDEYVEEEVVEMTAEEIAKADQVEILTGKRERKQVQREDMVAVEVDSEDEPGDDFQLVQCDCKCWRRVHKHVLEELPTKVFRVCDVCEMMHEVIVPAGEELEGNFKCGDVNARCYGSPERGSKAAEQLYGDGAWRDEDKSPVGFSCSTINLACGKSVTCICCGQHMKLNDSDRQFYFQGEMNDSGIFTHEPGDWQHADFGQQCPIIEHDDDYKPDTDSEDESEEEYQDSESEEEYQYSESEEESDEASRRYKGYEYRKINGKHVRFLVKEVGGGNYEESDHEESEEIIKCEAPVSEKKYDEGGVIEEAYCGVIFGNKRKREELPEAEVISVISDAEESDYEAVEVPYEVVPKKQKVETDEIDTVFDDSDIFA